MKDQVTILIVEDELVTATSIAELLEEEDFEIAGIAKDAGTALRLCNGAQAPPAVVVCDINIQGDVNGVELAKQLKDLYSCEVVFLTAFSDSKTLQAAFATEPVMYVVKPYSDTQLLVAVQLAFHRVFKSQQAAAGQSVVQLTDREREVAMLVAQGLSSKQIARNLNISVETVKTHRRRMLSKNNIRNFPQLVYLLNAGS
ncbi:DNA-binding response regulator [Paraflavitalea sp. CAU 1676]|uniref:DNA-binding response regulator n=1 Tax=Paraflavitalea sp. CAU 1676 TaxID=3032598 RepID=UPI0023DC9E6A|nr:DNA-binding response regulator [Paraflavitalea sp. CAU 1676]MDF2188814.1 DNA-binding response regulator [Paraflavitalea sp. CAU 1676]